jgi:outer membrane protein assembly factor BamE (lipoprotein component of BamABCDE complex)
MRFFMPPVYPAAGAGAKARQPVVAWPRLTRDRGLVMRTKPLAIGLLAAAAVAMALSATAFVYLSAKERRINRATASRITPGMTRLEVEALLGCPPGDYTTRGWEGYSNSHYNEPYWGKSWVSDAGEILVDFDPEGKVRAAAFYDFIFQETRLERLRRAIGF